MICLGRSKQGPDILIGYLEGSLEPSQAAELARHAEECADCRELMAVWNRLDEWPAPAVSPDFDARLYALIVEAERAPKLVRWWRQWKERVRWRPAVPLAAIAATAVFAVALLVRAPEPPENTAKDIRSASPDIEQVEQALQDLDLLMPLNNSSGVL